MAQLQKERARKPILVDAAAVASQAHIDGVPYFRLDLIRYPEPNYSVLLTRAEMLGVTAEWLKIESCNVNK